MKEMKIKGSKCKVMAGNERKLIKMAGHERKLQDITIAPNCHGQSLGTAPARMTIARNCHGQSPAAPDWNDFRMILG